MSAAGKFVSHTNGTRTIDGASGKNNKMERGASVSANPIWSPGGSQKPTQRFDGPFTDSDGGGDLGSSVPERSTPKNQHGITGKVEPAHKQPNLRGHNAG
jgi:hypothetical protein